MSQRFRRNIPALQKLHKSGRSAKKKLIAGASNDLISALCDCACNIVNGKVPLSTKQFDQLKSYHKQLKSLTKKRSSQKSKREILQSGGFLGALLKPIAQLLLGGLIN